MLRYEIESRMVDELHPSLGLRKSLRTDSPGCRREREPIGPSFPIDRSRKRFYRMPMVNPLQQLSKVACRRAQCRLESVPVSMGRAKMVLFWRAAVASERIRFLTDDKKDCQAVRSPIHGLRGVPGNPRFRLIAKLLLRAGNSLILQDSHHNPAIFCLTFRRSIRCNLVGRTHGSWC